MPVMHIRIYVEFDVSLRIDWYILYRSSAKDFKK